MAIEFLTGQRLTADLLNTNVIDYFPATTVKSSSTARNTTTTLAADPALTGIELGVGTWEIELLMHFTVASTTPRLKTRWGFTGTWTGSALRTCIGPGNVAAPAGGPEAMQELTVRAYQADSQDAIYNTTTSGAFAVVREICRSITVTVAGDLSLQWAQSTSNASNVTVQSDSSFTVRRISA